MASDADIRRLADDPDLSVEISTGTEHWQVGEITLVVAGSGDVEVIHRQAGTETRYTGSLDHDELEHFSRGLADNGFLELAPTRTEYVPDESTVTLALRRGGEDLHRAFLPEGERHDRDELDRLIRDYEQLVERVTGGALPWGSAAQPR
jgi:hypothetical protein